jgi:hypothetical protein
MNWYLLIYKHNKKNKLGTENHKKLFEKHLECNRAYLERRSFRKYNGRKHQF